MRTLKTSLSSLFVLLMSVALITGCSTGNSKQDMLTKKWKYDKVNVNGQEMSGQQIGSPTMEFKDDNTYNMDFGGMSEQGEWTLDGDSLTTISQKNDQEQTLFIKEIKEEQMIVEGNAQQGKMTITLVPYTGEEEESGGEEESAPAETEAEPAE